MTWILLRLLVWPVFQAGFKFPRSPQFHFPALISHFSRAAFWNFAGSAICGIYVERA